MRSLAEDLAARRVVARLGGGEEKIARQHEAGKLTARERIALLIDDGTFCELGIHAQPHFSQRAMEGRDAPADGVITGYGRVDGRMVCVCAYDFTVMAGAMGMTGERKVARLRELALTQRVPFVWLLDSAGARIQEAVGSLFAGTGQLFREEVVMSGVVPQVAALMGPCAAGTAYIPGLADFVPMVRGRGSMALAGPRLVRAAIGEDVTQEELGGSRVHCRKSGVGDIEVASDEECIAVIKAYHFGAAVNLAARVSGGASGDEVLLTGQTAALAPELEGVLYEPRGRRELRNVREPVELFAAVRAGEASTHDLPRDPVCRMAVDPERSAGRLTYEDTAYFFRSLVCAAEFARHPERFTR